MSHNLEAKVIDTLRLRHVSIATAESLTGGGVCSRLVNIAGASDVLRGGICTYALETKAHILGVPADLLHAYGPVHPDVAAHMARGAQRLFAADVALSTTGVAGPWPADGHPAGTVYIACAYGENVRVELLSCAGDRDDVRQQTITAALKLCLEILEKLPAE